MLKLGLAFYLHTQNYAHMGAVKGHPSVLIGRIGTPGQVKAVGRGRGGGEREKMEV